MSGEVEESVTNRILVRAITEPAKSLFPACGCEMTGYYNVFASCIR